MRQEERTYLMEFYIPTIEDVRTARRLRANRPNRDAFYDEAKQLIDQAITENSWSSVTKALVILLKTWNKNFYRFPKNYDENHVADIEQLLQRYATVILGLRQRCIDTFSDTDKPIVTNLFQDFENVVGRVGAAKSLHLLAPSFFPLWDTKIAKAYRCRLQRQGKNGPLYCRFMQITKAQYETLGGKQVLGPNPLKALDAYNFERFIKKQMP